MKISLNDSHNLGEATAKKLYKEKIEYDSGSLFEHLPPISNRLTTTEKINDKYVVIIQY